VVEVEEIRLRLQESVDRAGYVATIDGGRVSAGDITARGQVADAGDAPQLAAHGDDRRVAAADEVAANLQLLSK
jgi:hypothetical protein